MFIQCGLQPLQDPDTCLQGSKLRLLCFWARSPGALSSPQPQLLDPRGNGEELTPSWPSQQAGGLAENLQGPLAWKPGQVDPVLDSQM